MPSPVDITSLSPLNADIRAAILDHLRDTTHKPTLFTILLVSRKSYSRTFRKLYIDVVLDSTNFDWFLGPILVGDDQAGASELRRSAPSIASPIVKAFYDNEDLQLHPSFLSIYLYCGDFATSRHYYKVLPWRILLSCSSVKNLNLITLVLGESLIRTMALSTVVYESASLMYDFQGVCDPDAFSIRLPSEVQKLERVIEGLANGHLWKGLELHGFETCRHRIACIYSSFLPEIPTASYNNPAARIAGEDDVWSDLIQKEERGLPEDEGGERQDPPIRMQVVGKDDPEWDLPYVIYRLTKF
ncbi:hypothetical protein IAR50_001767 [Cryptococcus sp. DSM 104548]